MGEIAETISSFLGLQEEEEEIQTSEAKARTLEEFLRDEEMEIAEQTRTTRSWKDLKERIGFRSIGCCGATWRFKSVSAINSTTARTEHTEQEEEEENEEDATTTAAVGPLIPATADEAVVGQNPMNLAAALAAERHFRATQDRISEVGPTGATTVGGGGTAAEEEVAVRREGSPAARVSLMRLLEEGVAEEVGEGNDRVCCVCMMRKKGAAFIPCGHTFCRVCSRETWLNRGTCPLCNRSINEILDIY